MKKIFCYLLTPVLVANLSLLAFAEQDVDTDGPLTATASRRHNGKARTTAYSSVSSGEYEMQNGWYVLNVSVPNPATPPPYQKHQNFTQGTVFDSLFAAGRHRDMSKTSASSTISGHDQDGNYHSASAWVRDS
ncbi:MAG: hypothetical protein OXN25_14555 [Candidatus Poribacteria bacterium]|nr:hypothetical protein [Candidatus Poribacteria bacterium]